MYLLVFYHFDFYVLVFCLFELVLIWKEEKHALTLASELQINLVGLTLVLAAERITDVRAHQHIMHHLLPIRHETPATTWVPTAQGPGTISTTL